MLYSMSMLFIHSTYNSLHNFIFSLIARVLHHSKLCLRSARCSKLHCVQFMSSSVSDPCFTSALDVVAHVSFNKYKEKVTHSPEKEQLPKPCVSPSARLPVAKECSRVLFSACIRSQEDMGMNVFLQKNLRRTDRATFSLAMRRLM